MRICEIELRSFGARDVGGDSGTLPSPVRLRARHYAKLTVKYRSQSRCRSIRRLSGAATSDRVEHCDETASRRESASCAAAAAAPAAAAANDDVVGGHQSLFRGDVDARYHAKM